MPHVKDFDELWDHVEQHEGRRHRVYVDTAGHPSIGIGFNLDRTDASTRLAALGLDPARVRSGEVALDDEQVDQLFADDLSAAIAGAQRLVPRFDALSAKRQHACVDLTFNLGASGFARFTKTLAAIDAGDFAEAARELEASRWFTQVGRRGPAVVAKMRDGA